ncbi:hypothetical protein H6758_02900 [Candidatus Nomurabacteria bacterium]|nr:hypothetical protein [Candidatus Nomurabacteria bacterium]
MLSKLSKKAMLGFGAFLVLGTALVPASAGAAEVDDDVNTFFGVSYAQKSGLGNRDVRDTIASIIRVALSLLGIIALLIILAGGFQWMTAGGNDDKVQEARKRMIQGVIGLAIIMSAYAISIFVIEQLSEATQSGQADAADLGAGDEE